MLDSIVHYRVCFADTSGVAFLAHTGNDCRWQDLILHGSAVRVLLTPTERRLEFLSSVSPPLVPGGLSSAHSLKSSPSCLSHCPEEGWDPWEGYSWVFSSPQLLAPLEEHLAFLSTAFQTEFSTRLDPYLVMSKYYFILFFKIYIFIYIYLTEW